MFTNGLNILAYTCQITNYWQISYFSTPHILKYFTYLNLVSRFVFPTCPVFLWTLITIETIVWSQINNYYSKNQLFITGPTSFALRQHSDKAAFSLLRSYRSKI